MFRTITLYLALFVAAFQAVTFDDNSEPSFLSAIQNSESPRPFQVVLTLPTKPAKYCGGALVSLKWVLSAASCAQGNWKDISVTAGLAKFNDPTSKVRQTAKVKNVTFQGEGGAEPNKAVLFELDKELKLSPYVSSINLPTWDMRHESFSNYQVMVSGWGGPKGMRNELTKIEMPLVSTVLCERSFRATYEPCQMKCARGSKGEKSEEGDIGVPVTIVHETRGLMLVGIVVDHMSNIEEGGYTLSWAVAPNLPWIANIIRPVVPQVASTPAPAPAEST